MTTPRVTVPVEPTEAMMRAWHRSAWPQGPEVSPMSQAGLAFKRHYAAMLSAAPAPEGGAARDWGSIRSDTCYDEHQPGCDCAALATREEV